MLWRMAAVGGRTKTCPFRRRRPLGGLTKLALSSLPALNGLRCDIRYSERTISSSATRQWHGEGAISVTERMLDTSASPIGTFNSELVDSSLHAARYWTTMYAGSSLAVHSLSAAGRILRRIDVERAAGNSWACDTAVVKQVSELRTLLCEAWLDVEASTGGVGADSDQMAHVKPEEDTAVLLDTKSIDMPDDNLLSRFKETVASADEKCAAEVEYIYDSLSRLDSNREAHQLMLDFYTRVNPKGTPASATRVLQRMYNLSISFSNEYALTIAPFNQVLKLWEESGESQAQRRVHEIADWISELDGQVNPDATTYVHMLRVLLNDKGDGLKWSNDKGDGLKSSGTFYTTLNKFLDCWKVGHTNVEAGVLSDALSRAVRELSMEKLETWDRHHAADELVNRAIAMGIQPSASILQTLLVAHANSRRGLQAERVLDQMVRLHHDGIMEEGPEFSCYEHTVRSLAGSKKRKIVKKMEHTFSRLLDRCEAGEIEYSCDRLCSLSCTVMGVMASSGALRDAELVLTRMLSILTTNDANFLLINRCFRVLLKVYANRGDIENLESTLYRLFRSADSGGDNLAPDAINFDICIRQYSKAAQTANSDSGTMFRTKAVDLFEQQIKLYESGNESAKPKVDTFKTVIVALKDIGGQSSLGKALDLVTRISEIDVTPTTYILNNVLQLCRNVGDKAAAEQSIVLLERMITGRQTGKEEGFADIFSFEFTISTIVKGWGEGAALRAFILLPVMDSVGICPDVHIYNHILAACARTVGGIGERRAVLELVVKTIAHLKRASSNVVPNEITYVRLVEAYDRTIPRRHIRDRTKLMESALRMCCADALLSPRLLWIFDRALPNKYSSNLLKEIGPGGTVPGKWSRNVTNSS